MIFYNIYNKLFDTNIASEDCERSQWSDFAQWLDLDPIASGDHRIQYVFMS